MKQKRDKKLTDLGQKVFDIKNEAMPRGAWWWWFWLFFFNNPHNPAKPRQLMILWSAKNEREIICNDLKIKSAISPNNSKLRGAVASWYFDGEKMNHNFLLDPCNIHLSDHELSTDSTRPTSFTVNKTKNTIKIGNDFEFITEAENNHKYIMPIYRSHTYIGNMGYSLLRLNRLDLKGVIKNKRIHGTAYFQRVFVNALSPAWYWGVFHFDNGGILTYFNPHLFGKSLKRDILFFDSKRIHKFTNINIKRLEEDLPKFEVSGENDNEKIKFTVSPYSHSSWTFRKKTLGFIPNKLVYNEYPAVISDLDIENKKNGKRVVLKDLGKSVGNAEHTTGFLF